jgi:hypothetical protein
MGTLARLLMSHHFDTPTAREDPRINLCDIYLFSGGPASTVMAMTVNPDAGLSAPDTFREEGLYAFRFDLDGDAREELAFKVTFGPPSHADGDDHKHEQTFEVLRSPGAAALKGANGDLIAAGTTGAVVKSKSGVTVFAGLAPRRLCTQADRAPLPDDAALCHRHPGRLRFRELQRTRAGGRCRGRDPDIGIEHRAG